MAASFTSISERPRPTGPAERNRPAALRYWQVWDRTADKPLPAGAWTWDAASGTVTVAQPVPFHAYTVSFLAWRLWEEINMYNHVTNSWTSEHLLPVDPRTPQAQEYLYDWLKKWCEAHPQTNVVRFTSMFYNFVWIWGSDKRNQNLFTDWGSYDFTVSEKALDDFAAAYGYALTAEDFINKGSLQVTHMPPTAHKRDYMEFTQQFVAGFGKKLVDLVHHYGKRAYVFYDDSWVGVEPYGPHFKEFGFDGIIKCVFSGYEARMCAGVDAPVHELRLHPYLFPVGLGGAPTFAPGGNPSSGAETHGLLASLNSVAKLPYHWALDGISNTQTINPEALGHSEGERKENLVQVMDGYFDQGAHHLNVNVFGKEKLLDAMEHPEKEEYANFTIRVSGYAVKFIDLTREQQMDVISRTCHAAL